ncbi:hypothetical protein H0H92_014943 [Tricholoma furcatifolium]|nr:hypothetical protein H0H92_014943 [Tricholoma furcatifolium]
MSISSIGVAFVTGASRGIGRAIALRLAKDGFDVGLNDLPSARENLNSLRDEIRGQGRRATVAVGDVSLQKDVQDMVDVVVRDLAPVEEWDKLFSVNARGVFLCYKYAALQMIKQGHGGRIIGASSLAGRRATEWGPHGITVNSYCPVNEIVDGTKAPSLEGFYDQICAEKELGSSELVRLLVTMAKLAMWRMSCRSLLPKMPISSLIGIDGGKQYS